MNLYISKKNYSTIIDHCVRKLNAVFFDDETRERQAFGIIIGQKVTDGFMITRVINLKRNYRFQSQTSLKMNSYIEKYAIPGGMEVSERAWAIDPLELNSILIGLSSNEIFLGTYHMHSEISWDGNFPKNLPTKLDRELNYSSGLINLIVYIGDNKREIRAFYESDIASEYDFKIVDEEKANENKV